MPKFALLFGLFLVCLRLLDWLTLTHLMLLSLLPCDLLLSRHRLALPQLFKEGLLLDCVRSLWLLLLGASKDGWDLLRIVRHAWWLDQHLAALAAIQGLLGSCKHRLLCDALSHLGPRRHADHAQL